MRKSAIVQIGAEGRDKGKVFVITEWPAMKAERWAGRAFLALAHSGVDLGPEARNGGMAGLAAAGLKALHSLDFDEVQPLLDEMWSCVQVRPDPKTPDMLRSLMMNGMEGDDIEEVATLWTLREAIFRLHTDFFFKGK
jgi:hypothetical protein